MTFTGNENRVQNSRDGSIQQSSKRVFVIMTDGVEDILNSINGQQSYADATPWTQDKTSNASVAALRVCAGKTDGTHYFLASQPADIKKATDKIIGLALSHPIVLALPATTSGP